MIKRCARTFALLSIRTARPLLSMRPQRPWVRTALVLLSMQLALGAGAAAAAQASGNYASWRKDAARALIERGDAGSLAAAAALRFVEPAKTREESAAVRSAAVDLASKASELAPASAAIGWLRLELCANTAGCDVRDAATTLRWVDADNGAVWLSTLTAAEKDKDSMEIDRVLQEMTRATRFDFYWNRTIVLLFDAFRKARHALPANYLPSDLSRLSEATLLADAEIVPPLGAIASACRDAGGAERRESCLRLARIMQRGDTVGVQLAGFAIAKRLYAPDSKEWRALAERRRVLEWRVSSAARDEEPLLPWLQNALARERIALMRAAAREEDLDIAVLRKRRLPLEPPEAP
jgi:hypothetical protein